MRTSTEILQAAMAARGVSNAVDLARRICSELPRDQSVGSGTVAGWLRGQGIPLRYWPALALALPDLDVGELATALGAQAARRAGTAPQAGGSGGPP